MVDDPARPLQRRERHVPTPLENTLGILKARPPKIDEVAALKALTHGNATPGQQRLAMTYIMQELCGVTRVAFGGEMGVFLSGTRAVGIAIGQITDVVIMRFPSAEEPPAE